MPCIIFGINNGTFCERNITEPIDWKLIRDFYFFKEKTISNIVEKLNELKEYIHNEFINYLGNS